MTIAFGRLLGQAFAKSGKLSNLAVDGALVSCMLIGAFLGIYSAMGSQWASYTGAACIILAIASIALALSAQTISQVIRFFSKIVAKSEEQKAPVFKEDTPLYAKLIKKAFKTANGKGINLFRPIKTCSSSETIRSNVHVRANMRAHRSASRPTFARPSGDGNNDSSGESDSGEPPRPPLLLALPTLFSPDDPKWNSLSYPQRLLRRYDCRHMRRRGRFSRRWSV